MAWQKYIQLTNSDSSLDKRFRVYADGYVQRYERKESVRSTISGKTDVTEGAVVRSWQLVLKVYETDPDAGSGYGDLADIRTFIGYNDPEATPTNVITLTGFNDANTWETYIVGDISIKNISPRLDGETGCYRVQLTLMEA